MRSAVFIFLLFTINFARGQSFFTPTTYSGAFDQTDWTKNWSNWTPRNTSYPAGTTVLQGIISSNTTLQANKTYLLKGFVYVRNNATLTIEPGTIIRCDVLSSATLIITRGSKLICNGTESKPVIFTSSEAAGSRTYGDWGGVVILGNARINASGSVADIGAGINNSNNDGLFGGFDDEDSSGSMTYTRIEFAGIQYQPDKEINGLSLGGVGSKTHFDHIMISYCGNDGLHISGGKARLKHVIFHRGFDTDLSVDLGYSGLMQFCVILRDSTKANAGGVSGIEIQNNGLSTQASPFTDPTFSNFTVLGPLTLPSTPYNSNYRYAIHQRRNGRCAIFNSAFAGYPKGLVFDGNGVANQVNGGYIVFNYCFLAGNKTQTDTTGKFGQVLPTFSINDWVTDNSRQNNLLSKPRDLKLKNPYVFDAPEFILQSGSPLSGSASFSHIRLSQTESLSEIELNSAALFATADALIIKTIAQQPVELVLYDMCGRIRYKAHQFEKANGGFSILKPKSGVYLVHLQLSDGKIQKSKLLVE